MNHRHSKQARDYTLQDKDKAIGIVGVRKRDCRMLYELFREIGRRLIYLGNIDDGSNMERNVRSRAPSVDLILWNPRHSRHLKSGWNRRVPIVHFRSVSEIRSMIDRSK